MLASCAFLSLDMFLPYVSSCRLTENSLGEYLVASNASQCTSTHCVMSHCVLSSHLAAAVTAAAAGHERHTHAMCHAVRVTHVRRRHGHSPLSMRSSDVLLMALPDMDTASKSFSAAMDMSSSSCHVKLPMLLAVLTVVRAAVAARVSPMAVRVVEQHEHR